MATCGGGRISWDEVKGRATADHTYFNGALFGRWDIRGWVTLRNCTVKNAFNALRMGCKADPNLTRGRNLNVVVHGCRFEHIRDNAIEPEAAALSWWIFDNEMYNCHAPFSLHGLHDGYWYIFNNRIWFDSQAGREGQSHRDRQHLKLYLAPGEPLPKQPWYVFHNSVFLRSTYAKHGETRGLKHFNNAKIILFQRHWLQTLSGPSSAQRPSPFAGMIRMSLRETLAIIQASRPGLRRVAATNSMACQAQIACS